MLAFNHVVRNVSIVSRNQFGDAVREHHAAAQRGIFLDDRCLALVFKQKKIPRMGHPG